MAMGVVVVEVEVLQVDLEGLFRQTLFHVNGSLHCPLDVKVGGRYKFYRVVQLQGVGSGLAVVILWLPSMIHVVVCEGERFKGGKEVQAWG